MEGNKNIHEKLRKESKNLNRNTNISIFDSNESGSENNNAKTDVNLKDIKFSQFRINYKNVIPFDRRILQAFETLHNLQQTSNLHDFMENLLQMCESVAETSGRIQNIDVFIKRNGEIGFDKNGYNLIPALNLDFAIRKRPFQFLFANPYQQNCFAVSANVDFNTLKHPKHLSRWIRDAELAYRYKFYKNYHSLLFRQELNSFKKIRSEFQFEIARFWLDTNIKELSAKKQLIFSYDLNSASDIFRSNYLLYQRNYLFLKLTQKSRSNLIDTDHISTEILQRAFADTKNSIKLGVFLNKGKASNFEYKLKLQTELGFPHLPGLEISENSKITTKSQEDSKSPNLEKSTDKILEGRSAFVIKTGLFARTLLRVGNKLHWQSSLHAGFLNTLQQSSILKPTHPILTSHPSEMHEEEKKETPKQEEEGLLASSYQNLNSQIQMQPIQLDTHFNTHKQLMCVNDMFYIRNFKAISNIGEKYYRHIPLFGISFL